VADAGLVDFLDHLLEWSGDHAIFILVLSRPEAAEQRGLRLSRRSITALPLDPLSDEVIEEMLDSLVEGLPTDAKARIVARAEGIPLYGIETIRSLLDKGVLERDPDGTLHLLRATGQKDALAKLGELATPPGLTALISSRLDGLHPDERRLVKECSVLGASFLGTRPSRPSPT
jgi:predicted ATPase